MMAGRTFGKKLAAGFGLTLGLTVVIAVTSVATLAFVVNSNNKVIARATDNLSGAQRLETTMESRISDYRAFLFNGQQQYLDLTNGDRTEFLQQIVALRGLLTDQRARALVHTLTGHDPATSEETAR